MHSIGSLSVFLHNNKVGSNLKKKSYNLPQDWLWPYCVLMLSPRLGGPEHKNALSNACKHLSKNLFPHEQKET